MNLSGLSDDEMKAFMRETLRRLNAIALAEGHAFIAITYKTGMSILLDMDSEMSLCELEDAKDAGMG